MLHEVTEREAGLLRMLFPHLAGLDIRHVEDLGSDGVRITAGTGTASAACRGCGTVSVRVHDRYRRRLADLACGGRPVQVVLEVCRFRCGNRRARRPRSLSRCPGWPAGISAAPRGCGACWRRPGWRWPAARAPGWPPRWARSCPGSP